MPTTTRDSDQLDHRDLRLLIVLYELAREDVGASLEVLAAVSCEPWQRVVLSLERLQESGLVDPERVRLTLPGLTVAAALHRRDDEEERGSGDLAA